MILQIQQLFHFLYQLQHLKHRVSLLFFFSIELAQPPHLIFSTRISRFIFFLQYFSATKNTLRRPNGFAPKLKSD
jgi:hypothetical protein